MPDEVLTDPTPISADLQLNQQNCTNFEGEIEVINETGGQNSNYSYHCIWNCYYYSILLELILSKKRTPHFFEYRIT